MTDDLIKRLRFFGSPVEREAADRIEELEAACWRMQEERDRAIGWRDSDKDRADKAEAKLLEQVMALPEIAVLVDALRKSADGWDNVIGMGLIAKKHFESARVLRDEAFDALQRVGVEL